jgi:hypothetical protein
MAPRRGGAGHRPGFVLHHDVAADERHEALPGHHGAREPHEQQAEFLECGVDLAQVGDEHHQRARRDVAAQRVAAAEIEHGGRGRGHEQVDEPPVEPVEPQRLHLRLEAALVLGVEARALVPSCP